MGLCEHNAPPSKMGILDVVRQAKLFTNGVVKHIALLQHEVKPLHQALKASISWRTEQLGRGISQS